MVAILRLVSFSSESIQSPHPYMHIDTVKENLKSGLLPLHQAMILSTTPSMLISPTPEDELQNFTSTSSKDFISLMKIPTVGRLDLGSCPLPLDKESTTDYYGIPQPSFFQDTRYAWRVIQPPPKNSKQPPRWPDGVRPQALSAQCELTHI